MPRKFDRDKQGLIDEYQAAIDSRQLLDRYSKNIPQALKDAKNWQFWKAVPKGNEKSGFQYHPETGEVLWGKPPYSPLSKTPYKPCSGTDPKLFMDFHTAMLRLDEDHFLKQKFYSGLMFNVTPGDSFVLIDLDHCFTESGKLTDEAREIVSRFGSYTEISQSGEGIHIIIQDPGFKENRNAGGYEVYGSKGRLAMTGNLLHPDLNEVQNCHEALQWFYKTYIGERKQENFADSKASGKESDLPESKFQWAANPLSDKDVLLLAEKYDKTGKFQRYFHLGEPAVFPAGDDRAGEEDLSGSMQGLANILAFYCGNEQGRDLEQIDRLIRQSALFAYTEGIRAKWDAQHNRGEMGGQTYSTWGQMTICNAVMGLESFFGSKSDSTGEGMAPSAEKLGLFNEDLLPLNLAKRQPFPLDVLPSGIRYLCSEIARETSSSIDYAACGVLAMMSIPLASKVQVEVHGGHKTPLSLFMMINGNASSGKSSAFNKLIPALEAYEKEARAAEGPKISEREADRKILEKRRRTVELELDRQIEIAEGLPDKKGNSPTDKEKEIAEALVNDLKGKLIDIEEALKANPVLYLPKIYITGDITAEKFIDVLDRQNGKISIANDEGSSFVNILCGQYSKKPTIAPFIQMFEGAKIEQNRIGRGDAYIPHSAGSILLYVQPDVLKDFITTKGVRSQGLASRFLIVDPEVQPIDITQDHSEADYQALAEYENLLRCLFKLPDMDPANLSDKRSIRLTDEAYNRFERYRVDMTNSGRMEGGKHYDMSDIAGKCGNKALRLAGVLHCMKHHDDPLKYPITDETMKKGIQLANYFLSHAEYIFGGTGGEIADAVVRIIKKLRSFPTHPDIVKVSDITRMFSRHRVLGKMETIQPVLDFMEERNIIATREDLKISSRTRKNARGPYQVNRKIFTDEGLKQLGLNPKTF